MGAAALCGANLTIKVLAQVSHTLGSLHNTTHTLMDPTSVSCTFLFSVSNNSSLLLSFSLSSTLLISSVVHLPIPCDAHCLPNGAGPSRYTAATPAVHDSGQHPLTNSAHAGASQRCRRGVGAALRTHGAPLTGGCSSGPLMHATPELAAPVAAHSAPDPCIVLLTYTAPPPVRLLYYYDHRPMTIPPLCTWSVCPPPPPHTTSCSLRAPQRALTRAPCA